MSKSGSFTLVLTVICLSVLMSLEADAQSTTDETNSCSSSSLEEVVNLVERIASVQEGNAKKIEKLASVQQEIKEQQKENAKEIKSIASVQQQNAKKMEKIAMNQQEIKSIKELLASNSSALQEVANVVESIASVQQEMKKQQQENAKKMERITSKTCESEAVEPSKQALVSALVSE